MAETSDHVIIGDLPVELDEEGLRTNFEAYGTIKWCKLYEPRNGTRSALIEFSSVDEATWLVENLNGNVPLGLDTEVSVKFKPKNAAKGGGKANGGYGGFNGNGGKGGARSSPYGGIVPGGGKGGKMGTGKGVMLGKGEPSTIEDLWKGLLRYKVLPGGTWANDEKTVLINGLPSDTTDHDLLKIFSPFGAIAPGGVRVTLNEDGTAKGNGMINFLNLESTENAINTLNNCMMPDGRCLRLKQWSDWKGGKDGKKGGKNGGGKNGGGKGGKNGLISPSAKAAVAEAEVEG